MKKANPEQLFSCSTLSRRNIAELIEAWADALVKPDDPRLTDKACQAFARRFGRLHGNEETTDLCCTFAAKLGLPLNT